ncbi:ATP-binding protein [bacterium]|nr:ATP-binding protein [bacterium]
MAIIIDKVVSAILKRVWSKAQATETAVLLKRELGIRDLVPGSSFEDVYVCTLLDYCEESQQADEDMLAFLRDPEIRKAFQEAFLQNDEKVFRDQQRWSLARSDAGKLLQTRGLDVDVEMVKFAALFMRNARRTFDVQGALTVQKVEHIEHLILILIKTITQRELRPQVHALTAPSDRFPATVTLFGRGDDETLLRLYLKTCRPPVIQLIGQSGVGKTALVAKVVHELNLDYVRVELQPDATALKIVERLYQIFCGQDCSGAAVFRDRGSDGRGVDEAEAPAGGGQSASAAE